MVVTWWIVAFLLMIDCDLAGIFRLVVWVYPFHGFNNMIRSSVMRCDGSCHVENIVLAIRGVSDDGLG